MSTFLDTLKQTTVLADGAMGTLLFRRTGRLSEHNHVYEAFNIDRPQTVTEAHFAYLQAGACCLTSNTFGANRTQLESYDEAGRLAAINRAGVELAGRLAEFRTSAYDIGQRRTIPSFDPFEPGQSVLHGLEPFGRRRDPAGVRAEGKREFFELGDHRVLGVEVRRE